MQVEIGRAIRVAHFIGVVLLVLITSLGPRSWSPWLFLYWMTVLIVNVASRCCPLTKLEVSMTHEDVTVIDPLLSILGVSTTKDHRYTFTLLVVLVMLVVSGARWTLSASDAAERAPTR